MNQQDSPPNVTSSKNKEKVKEYNKNYYAIKGDEIKRKLNARETCDVCGKSSTHQNMPRHRKSNACKRTSNMNGIGKFTDEANGVLINELIGLRSMLYSLLLTDNKNNQICPDVLS